MGRRIPSLGSGRRHAVEEMSRKPDFIDFLLSPRLRIGRQLLLQCVVFFMTIDVYWYSPEKPLSMLQRLGGWLIYFLMMNGIIYWNMYVMTPRFLRTNKFFPYLLSMAGAITVAICLVVIVQGYLYDISSAPAALSTMQIVLNTLSGIFTFALLMAGTSGAVLFGHWIRYSRRISELQSATLQSELKYLKNQINPHFLFNMLNNANVLVKRDPKEAAEVLFKLEGLLRYQIRDSSLEKVSLEADIRFLNDFLNLEKIRRDRFEYSIQVQGVDDSIQIEPLLFIPFVENAVKHNFDNENISYVRLSFSVKGKKLDFQCENSKSCRSIVKRGIGGIGLSNIRRRLELLYPGRHCLEINETEQNYTVNLHLDL